MAGPGDRSRADHPPEGLLEIGRIVRPHGIRGEVVVQPLTNRPERFEAGVEHRRPTGAPLVVGRARRHKGRWVVGYEGVTDRDRAEELRDTVLWGEPIEVLDEGEVWVHELVGRPVVDEGGEVRGRVVSVEVNPAHDILVLDTGALVPMVFVSEVTDDAVSVEVPEGLFDDDLVAANKPGVERRRPVRKRRRRRNQRGRDQGGQDQRGRDQGS